MRPAGVEAHPMTTARSPLSSHEWRDAKAIPLCLSATILGIDLDPDRHVKTTVHTTLRIDSISCTVVGSSADFALVQRGVSVLGELV